MSAGPASVVPMGLAALVLVGPGLSVAEAPEQPLRRISFRVESAREVQNDWMSASLSVTDEGPDPAALADRINRAMQWALDRARKEKRVRVESGGYQTHPVYDKSRIRGWRATQRIRIESGDFEATTALLGDLQSRLQLDSLGFEVSPERRRELEDELIVEALGAFQARAALVQKSLGASRYEIVQLGIDTPGASPPPPRPMLRSAMAEAAAVAPPAVEGGSSRLAVQVHATIELD